MRKLAIAYVAYADLGANSAATEHILQVVGGLARRGHRVTLICRGDGGRKLPEGVEVLRVGGRIAPAFDRKAAKKLGKLEFDILYLRDFLTASAVVDRAAQRGAPIVIEHNGLLHAEVPLSKKPWTKTLFMYDDRFTLQHRLRQARANIVVTEAIGDYLCRRYNIPRERFVHIPNGVDAARFAPARDKRLLRSTLGLKPEKAFWVGYIGSMYPWHVLDVAVRALELIADERDDVRFFIGGSGPELGNVKALVQKSRHRERFLVKSPLPLDESPSYIAAHDVMLALMDERVSPYCWQVKVNHAAACGVPSVITHHRQFSTLEQAGAAIGVRENSPEAVAEKIYTLLDEKKLSSLAQSSRKFVVERLSWDKIVLSIEEVLYKSMEVSRCQR